MRYKYLFPVATVAAPALTVPTVAAAKPSISVMSAPQFAGFSFVATFPGDAFTSGTYTVTAQEYDSVTVQPVGAEQVFTGSVAWGETVSVTIPAANDYLLWTYRVDSNADGEALTTYGERQLDCRPVAQPDPEPEQPTEPSEPDAPETPDAETPEADDPTTNEVVTEDTTTSGSPVVETPAAPVATTPVTAG